MGSISSLFTFTPVANVTEDEDGAPLDDAWGGVVVAEAAGVDVEGGAAPAAGGAAGACHACRNEQRHGVFTMALSITMPS